MPSAVGTGFREAIVGVVGGIVLSIVLGLIPTLPFVPSYYVGIFQLFEAVSLVGGILLIFAMEKWGIGYLLGWLLGMWIMFRVGLVESSLFTLYAVVGTVIFVGKILQKAENSLRNR